MPEDKIVSCSVCAWRATCAKRFSSGDSVALHCPDFTYDITLKEKEEKDDNARGEKDDSKQGS
ncbi:hypothetical protein [Hippea sp. KM1]|uniref:hypothetical protein n=1 Tax=Hippea sp. KM1 TaxID=944481 RepID=UPI00046D4911|nr:hypothetical protein [Hippea sp. KM1]